MVRMKIGGVGIPTKEIREQERGREIVMIHGHPRITILKIAEIIPLISSILKKIQGSNQWIDRILDMILLGLELIIRPTLDQEIDRMKVYLDMDTQMIGHGHDKDLWMLEKATELVILIDPVLGQAILTDRYLDQTTQTDRHQGLVILKVGLCQGQDTQTTA